MKKQSIYPNQDFLHGTKRFKKGRKYEVSGDDAKYFRENGWADSKAVKSGKSSTLKVHDGQIGHSAEVK